MNVYRTAEQENKVAEEPRVANEPGVVAEEPGVANEPEVVAEEPGKNLGKKHFFLFTNIRTH